MKNYEKNNQILDYTIFSIIDVTFSLKMKFNAAMYIC